ncbi:serine hydrolase, partial [Pseudomonas sp. BGM005]|nr:serine hydrolase [Pseudomonas sp. BG5]
MQLLSSRRFRAAAAGVAVLGLFLTGCTSDTTFSYTPPEQVDGALPDDTVTAM